MRSYNCLIVAVCFAIGSIPFAAEPALAQGKSKSFAQRGGKAAAADKKKAEKKAKPAVKKKKGPGAVAQRKKASKDTEELKESMARQEQATEDLRAEIAGFKEALQESGLIRVESEASLTPEQQAQIAENTAKIAELEAQIESYNKAIEGGLDPKLVEANIVEAKQQIDQLKTQIAGIEAQAGGERPPTLGEQVQANSATLVTIEQELGEMKKAAAEKEAEEEAAEKEEAEDPTVGERIREIGELLPVELFAFGDFQYVIQETGDDGFAIGQLELDAEQELADYLTISVAVAYDGEAEALGIGAFTIDGRLFGKEEGHVKQTDKIETSGVIFGQFDVPFGIDYFEYPSIDRRFVTGPLVVDETHGGWNDLGGQFYLDADVFNAIVYVVNGFGYETEDPDDPEATVPHEMAIATGARLGIRPLEPLEIGGSFAGFITETSKLDVMLFGADLALEAGGFSLKGEYIFHWMGSASDNSLRNQGFYGTAMYDFDPVFVGARYSMFSPDSADELMQLSGALGVKVYENVEVRFEYSSDLESGGSAAFIQLAGGTAWQPTGLRR